jgi:copper chaperone
MFHIPDMSCGHCKATVEKTIRTLDPEAGVAFDMAKRQVTLNSSADTTEVQAALDAVGYPATNTDLR